MPELPDDVTVMCQRLSRQMWRRVYRAGQATFDREDLEQEVLLAAWIRLEAEPDIDRDLLFLICSRRCIDWMRSVGRLGRKNQETGEYPRQTPISLDAPLYADADSTSATRVDLLIDTDAQEDFDRVDTTLDLEHAFASHRGSPRAAEVAWLNAQGIALADIGAHYGFTESRACQLRARFIEDVAIGWDTPAASSGRRAAA